MAKNVVILGCGRSGTKLVQLLVSRALLGNGLPISFYYEPLLWKSHTVKKIADDGVKIHKQMPLFWDRKSISESGRYVRFFGQFLSTKKYAVVTKFIRMVGRLSFVRETFPDAYIVFVFRNPLSVVKSIMRSSFSLLGPPHYPSDLTRLLQEGEALGLINSPLTEYLDQGRWAAEALFWYANHLFLLETVENFENNIFFLPFETLIDNKRVLFKDLCDFLEVAFDDHYLEFFNVPGTNVRFLSNLFVPSFRYQLALTVWGDINRGSMSDRISSPHFIDVRESIDYDNLAATVEGRVSEYIFSSREENLILRSTIDVYDQLFKLSSYAR